MNVARWRPNHMASTRRSSSSAFVLESASSTKRNLSSRYRCMAAGKISSLLEKWRYKPCFDRPAASASSSTEAFLKPKRLKTGTTALKIPT